MIVRQALEQMSGAQTRVSKPKLKLLCCPGPKLRRLSFRRFPPCPHLLIIGCIISPPAPPFICVTHGTVVVYPHVSLKFHAQQRRQGPAMALSISPTHDVLAYSPHARFAVLPDLPYAQTRPRGRSEITSPRGSPQVMSAPTSPLNRPHYPAVSPLTHISPISLPASTSHASASTPSCSRPEPLRLPASVPTLTPQQMAKSQAAQAINSSNSQSYFPPQRRSPPGSSASLPSSMTFVPPAPLSSTNLASLAKGAVDVPGRSRARSRPRAPAGLPEEPGSGSETERGGGSDSDVTVVDHRRIGKASYSQTDIPALRRRLTSNAEAGPSGTSHYQQSKQQGNGTSGKIRDTDTITLPRPVGGRKTPPKTPPSRPLSLNQAHGSLPASGPSQPISPGKSPRSRSHTSLASLRRSPTTSPKNALHPLRRSPTSSPRGSSHSLTPLTPVTPYSLSPNLRGAGQATSSDADGEDDSQTDEMTDSSVSFRTRSHSGLRRRSAPTGSASGLGLSLGHDTGVDLAKASDELLPEAIERLYRSSSLLYLRILSIMPSCWGTSVLCHALVTGSIRYDVWPWGADFSREALYQLSHGGGEYEGDWKRAIRGDLILCIAWVRGRGHHAPP